MVLSFMISNKTGSAASLYSPPIGMNQLPGPICAGGKSIEGNGRESSFWNRVSGFFISRIIPIELSTTSHG